MSATLLPIVFLWVVFVGLSTYLAAVIILPEKF